MRKGAQRLDWSLKDERWLIDNAGTMPRRDVCFHLKRSNESVKQKVKHLREQGIDITLRHYKPKTRICTTCGCARSQFNRDGLCRPCELKALISRCDYEIAEAMRKMPDKDRCVYESTETQLSSGQDPRPRHPQTQGLSRYAKAKAEDHYDLAIEKWEIKNLHRLLKAKRRRLERMNQKIF